MDSVRSISEGYVSPETVDFVVQKVQESVELLVQIVTNKKVLAVTGALVGLIWHMKRTHGFFKDLGIPGPKPGLTGAFRDYTKQPISEYDIALTKKYGKVVGIFHARAPIYVVSDIDILKQILVKEFSSFVNRESTSARFYNPVFDDSLLLLHDDHWRFMRSTLSPTFSSARMREMVGILHVCVQALVDNVWKTSKQGTKAMNLMNLYGMFTMDAIATTAFGVEAGCQDEPEGNIFTDKAAKLVKAGKRTLIIFLLTNFLPGFGKLMRLLDIPLTSRSVTDFFVHAVHDAIQKRQQHGARNDFLQLLLKSNQLEIDRAEEDPDTLLNYDKSKKRGMTEKEIVSNALLFFLAGYDTTRHALSFLSYNLAVHPEYQDRLIDEIDTVLNGALPDYDSVQKLEYLDHCFLETLRLNPAAVRISRVANEDTEINGVLFKKNTDIHIPVYAIHRDPNHWSDPDTFNPDRFRPENRPENFNYVFLSFGAGPRNCIGMRLAHMQAKMAIVGLLQKYRFKTYPETKIPPQLEKATLKPTDGIMLGIEKR